MNAQQLEEIKERVAKATPGEWDVFDDIWVAQGDGLTIGENIAKCEVEADAEFVAYARQDVPDLIAEVERLQRYETKVDKIHDAITRMENQEIDGFDFGEEVLGILGRAW